MQAFCIHELNAQCKQPWRTESACSFNVSFARAFKQTVPQAYNLALDLRPTSESQASSPEHFWYSQREATPSLLGFETGKGQRSLNRVGSSQAEYLHSDGRRSIYAISLSLNSN